MIYLPRQLSTLIMINEGIQFFSYLKFSFIHHSSSILFFSENSLSILLLIDILSISTLRLLSTTLLWAFLHHRTGHGGLQSVGPQRVYKDWSSWASHRHTCITSLLSIPLTPPPSTPLGHHRGPSWAPCAI